MFLIADIITDGKWVFLGVLILMVFATAYGLYTRQGSGINKHPRPDSVDPVTADQEPENASPGDRAGVDETVSHELDQRGVK